MKKRGWTIWVGGMLLVLLLGSSRLARAADPIRVVENGHSYVFGQELRFLLQVEGDHPLQSIVLAYRTLDTQGTTVEPIAFDAGTSISAEHVHQVQRRYVRPFVEITYWWTIQDVTGARLITEPKTFVYADDRFDWQAQIDQQVHLHWYQGDLQIAQQALDAAAAGLERVSYEVGATLGSDIVNIYMYANLDDLQIALPDPLARGEQALTLYGTDTVLVSFGPESEYIPQFRRVLPHEMTHVLLHKVTQSDLDRIPMWLSEGLATLVQYSFVPDPEAQSLLVDAVAERDVVPLNTLCSSFPYESTRMRLAYAQSASVVAFIRDRYGRQAVQDLVAAYADGATCEGGVQRVLDHSLDRLESQWLDSLAPRSPWSVFWQEKGAWVILALLLAGLPLLFINPSPIKPTQP